MVVQPPALWSLEQRNLYKLVTEVEAGGAVTDRYETPFGIRTCTFDAEKGFFLNGKSVKLKGTCNHQDHAGVGAALPDAVQYYRVRKLQEMGCNALRTSHNPPTPELLNAADELGMLVFDETRMMSSNPEGLAQLENLVRRDRNHPSVFMWSLGNEEGHGGRPTRAADPDRDEGGGPRGTTVRGRFPSRRQRRRQHGQVRLRRVATCRATTTPIRRPTRITKPIPKVPVMGTETGQRGGHARHLHDGPANTASSAPTIPTPPPAAPPARAGGASATRARGWPEASSGRASITAASLRPTGGPTSARSTASSTCAASPRTASSTSRRGGPPKPVLHLFPHWNWPGLEGQEIAVWVHSNLDRVELFLNGQSLGAKDMKKDSHLAWNVKYAPGDDRGARIQRRQAGDDGASAKPPGRRPSWC